MKAYFLFIMVGLFISGCSNYEYTTAEVDNPVFYPNTQFLSSEDLKSPKFGHLIEKYSLDTIFHGETDEFKRILLIRHWIKTVIKINDFGDPYPGNGYAEQILDNALRGQGYHCGHYMTVQNALMNAFGYVTRTLGAGPGGMDGSDGHHGINEIWLNNYGKWFLSDAKYDHHFEKDGIPLSALEIREEYLKNKAADIVKVKGPDRIPFDVDTETGYNKEQNARTYTWIEWHGYNNMFTVWPEYKELLIMYRDDFFRNNTWIWDGKPHWAYAQPEFMKPVDERNEIYWTPNTISSDVAIEGKVATIKLKSDTPNLREYQARQMPSTTWDAVDSIYVLNLRKKNHEIAFRAVNLAGVAGQEHRVKIERKTK